MVDSASSVRSLSPRAENNSFAHSPAVEQWFAKAHAQFHQTYVHNMKRLSVQLAEQQRQEEHAYQSRLEGDLASPLPTGKDEDAREKFKEEEAKRIEQVDAQERSRIDELRTAAKNTWATLEAEHRRRLEAIHSEQAHRLAVEQEWSRAASAGGAVLDRVLFEKIVEKCGKGRDSAYGKDKMARFWQVFDQDKQGSVAHSSLSDPQEDVINLLKGL